MMKRILVGVVVMVGGLIAFNWFTSGEVTLIPSSPLSAEGRAVERLDARFVAAAHRFNQAGRAAGVSGMDTTADAQAALDELDRVERDLLDLKTRTRSEATKRQIDEVLAKVRKVKHS